jgi:hypothetical protein
MSDLYVCDGKDWDLAGSFLPLTIPDKGMISLYRRTSFPISSRIVLLSSFIVPYRLVKNGLSLCLFFYFLAFFV